MLRRTGFFVKSNINQNKSNYSNTKGYLCLCNLWCQINHIFSNFLSAHTAISKHIIVNIISTVNTKGSLVANITTIQPAAKLVKSPDKTRSNDGLNNLFTTDSVTNFNKLRYE